MLGKGIALAMPGGLRNIMAFLIHPKFEAPNLVDQSPPGNACDTNLEAYPINTLCYCALQ